MPRAHCQLRHWPPVFIPEHSMADNDLIEALERRLGADPGRRDEAKPAIALPPEKSKFRFFGLPRELRDLVYEYATISEKPISLYQLRVPEFILANDAIRSESLPIFFASNTFFVGVYTNFDAAEMEGSSRRSHAFCSGLIVMHHETERWLNGQGPEMVKFLHVNFRVFLYGYGHWDTMYFHLPLNAPSDFDFRTGDASLACPEDRSDFTNAAHLEYGKTTAKVHDKMISAVKRPDYKGLTLEDLCVAAQGFRYWPDRYGERVEDREVVRTVTY